MKIASHFLAYDVDDTIEEVLKNISPHVDKIFIAYPEKPWIYTPHGPLKKNPTTLEFVKNCSQGFNVEIIKGDWKLDEDSRNACFNLAKNQGFDWFLQQDADEFYDEKGWELILNTLKKSTNELLFKTTWYNFWKNSEYVILNNKNQILTEKGNCAVRCLDEIKFIRGNLVNVTNDKTIDAKCFHFGYARSDDKMREKIYTWSHSHQFNQKDWFENKWLNWQINTRNLNPIFPYEWKKAINYEGNKPIFLNKFREEIKFQPITINSRFNNFFYDAKFFPRFFLRTIKNKLFKKN